MFDLEPDVAQRRIPASDKAEPTPDSPASARPAGPHDAASLLHLQRTVGNAGVVQLLEDERAQEAEGSPVHDVVGKGGGAPLDDATRGDMEARFGQDFGDVRVHTDAKASASAESVGANAYTVGSDIVFRGGHFDAGTPTGQRTLAHELSHVVQQRNGPVDGTDAPGGIRLSDPGDRFERAAESTADQVMQSDPAVPGTASPATAPAAVQRETGDEEDDETAQRVVQREEDDEEREDDEGAE